MTRRSNRKTMSAKDAAIEEERARQNLRELQAADKATQADIDRVRDAQNALDDARRR